MDASIARREVLKMAGVGSLALVGGVSCASVAPKQESAVTEFTFLQLTDTHIGFADPAINPDYAGTLPKAVDAVNRMPRRPDFIMFTGDLSHVTDDAAERRRRLERFREMAGALRVADVKFMPGEHDAGLDNGNVWHDMFGKSIYSFDHKGVHFIALDNVSDARAQLGDEQLHWLSGDLSGRDKDAPIVVFTHRPLFNLYPLWDWYTRDGAAALQLLEPFSNVLVLYGHIHQLHHHSVGRTELYAGESLIFPLPAAGSRPKREGLPWDPSRPYRDLGFRSVEAVGPTVTGYALMQFPMAPIATGATTPEMESTTESAAPMESTATVAVAAASPQVEQVVEIKARCFEYIPKVVTVKKGVPVVLKLTSLDRLHGFNCFDLGIRCDIEPKKVNELRFVPDKAGTFAFFCDIYCGIGHGNMNGKLIVTE